MTTKILALTDALGNLVDFRLMPGQAHDLRETHMPIRDLSAGHLLADRAIAMRSCKTDLSFKAFISVAATIIQIR